MRPARRLPFGLAIVSTLSVLLCAVAAIWLGIGGVRKAREQQARVLDLCATIERLDEVLTGSATLAACTGEPAWRRRYEQNLAPLDDAITELRAVSPALFDREVGDDTDAANHRLVELELAAFAKVAAGDLAAARAILRSDEYAADKLAYAEGTGRARQVLRDQVEAQNLTASRNSISLLLGTLALAAVAAFAWLRVLVAARSEHARVETAAAETRAALAAESSRAKSEFVANISHELRTPLTAILGHAELLADASLPPDTRRESLSTLSRNGQHLLQVINDLLDMSKIEAGMVQISPEPVDVATLVEEVLSLLRVRAATKGVRLERTFATPLPRLASLDPCRLRQILVNLVGNAIKFTAHGEVHVHLRCERTTATSARFDIAVRDTGIGMAPEVLGRLFQAFQQADATTARRFGGTGLGLAIARSFARLLGGDIAVASESGHGSTFSVTLPVAVDAATAWWEPTALDLDPRPSADAPRQADADLNGVRILLAEDGVDNQRLLTFLLRRAGADVVAVDNGRAACDLLLAPDAAFAVVLMDMQMPERDGYEATRVARRAGYTGPIVALTANAMSFDRERCLLAGCDDFLSKPVDRRLLLATCAQWAGAAAAE